MFYEFREVAKTELLGFRWTMSKNTIISINLYPQSAD